jgi:hypothetical protein
MGVGVCREPYENYRIYRRTRAEYKTKQAESWSSAAVHDVLASFAVTESGMRYEAWHVE